MSSVPNVSLYIPHVFANFVKADIIEAFEKVFIGKVSKIDFVSKIGNDRKPYNSAYIHFEYWYDNAGAVNFQNRVLNPNQEARLIYDEPWYWIVLENKSKKHIPGERKPCIDLGDLYEKKETSNVMCESKDCVIEDKNYDDYVKNHHYVKYLEKIYFETLSYVKDLQTQVEELKYEQALFNLPV